MAESGNTVSEPDKKSHLVKTERERNSDVVDETGSTFMEYIRRQFKTEPDNDPFTQLMRYKPPFTYLSQQDAFGEAMYLTVDTMLNKSLPMWVATMFAFSYLKENWELFGLDVPEESFETDKGPTFAKQVTTGINEFANRILAGEISLPERPPEWATTKVSYGSLKGNRSKQEDRFICLPTLKTYRPQQINDVGLYGVLDGHNGCQVAAFGTAHLPLDFAETLDNGSFIEDALRIAIEKTDDRLAMKCKFEPWNNIGATVVLASLDEKRIYIRWLGDSPAFLLTSTEVTQVTTDHNPQNEEEMKRIESVNGLVVFINGEYRLNGTINLSRALGDYSSRPGLSGESEGLVVERSLDQYLLILLCDGIADTFTHHQLYQLVEAFCNENDQHDYGDLADYLARNAIEHQSGDNVTAVVVYLRPPSDLWSLFKSDSDDDVIDSDEVDADP